MDIYSVFELLGGLAFFLYGMSVMSSSLAKMAGGSLETTLKKVTSNKILSFLLGALITVAIQSSSGFMVMLVGLVNSGIINFYDSLPMIMGSNVGSTITSWVLTLMGVSTDHFSLMTLLSPKCLSPILAFVGILLRMASKKQSRKDIGTIFVGFGILMYGMTFMSSSMSGLAGEPWFATVLTMFTNPFVALLISTVFTGIIQSSAAVIGIVQTLALTSGSITYQMAIPLILGANIGTCITSVISSIGTTKNAKRVAFTHVYVNCIGAFIVLVAQVILNTVNFPFFNIAVTTLTVAITHTLFNVFNTLLVTVIGKYIMLLVRKTVKEEPGEIKIALVDERLFNQPSVAVNECFGNTMVMAMVAREAMTKALSLLDNFNEEDNKLVYQGEELLDDYEDELGTYLVRLSRMETSEKSSETVSKMLHAITDFERMGDHAINIAKIAEDLSAKKTPLPEGAKQEINVIVNAINEILDYVIDAYNEENLDSAINIEPLEEVIDELTLQIKSHDIDRLKNAETSLELGIALNDILNNCERVSDHCSNIGACVLEINGDNFKTHEYLHKYKKESEQFKKMYQSYAEKYRI